MWQYTTESDSRANQRVKLLIATNGKLEMTRRDTLDFEILCSVSCQLQNFCSEVLEDCRDVNCGCGKVSDAESEDGKAEAYLSRLRASCSECYS